MTYVQALRFDQVELGRSSALSTVLDNAAVQTTLVKRTRIRVHGFEGVCRMVASGMGIGVIPSLLGPTHERVYDLKFVPLNETWAHPLICIVVRDIDSLPGAAKALVAHLRLNASVPSATP